MHSSDQTGISSYNHEVLKAKLDLKNHYLETIVKEIFEQTGQVLSLVRIRLTVMESQVEGEMIPDISDTGILIGQVSAKLREMSTNLFPEQLLVTDSGFISTIAKELSETTDDENKLEVFGSPVPLPEGMSLILIVLVLEIISSIKKAYGEKNILIAIEYTEKKLLIHIRFPEGGLASPGTDSSRSLHAWEKQSFQQRLGLIGAQYQKQSLPENTGTITLNIPLS